MLIYKKIVTILTLTCLLLSSNLVVPANSLGITIQEERELAKEFMTVIEARYTLVKDPVIVDYVNRIGKRILAAMPPQPYDYQFHVIHEDIYNAFATPAGHIFINTGLFAALESEEELAGILGHEIAHVVCRHISQRIESSKKINMAALAGMVAGVLLGAGGAGAAASALTVGSAAAGQALALAYSREDEMQADQLGLGFLTGAGYTGEGLLTSLEKIRSKQWYGSDQIPTYLTTHPASESRMSYIDNWLHQNHPEPVAERQPTGGFELAHTRVVALYSDVKSAISRFRLAVEKNPEDSMAHYGYALALSRLDRWTEAIEHMRRAIEGNAMATDMLQDLGKLYYYSGQYENAIGALSVSQSERFPEGQLYLGRTQLELGHFAEATRTLEDLVHNHDDYTDAYYYLGQSSGRMGDMYNAHFNLGRFYRRQKERKNAQFHLNRALKLAATPAERKAVEVELSEMKPQDPHAKDRQ